MQTPNTDQATFVAARAFLDALRRETMGKATVPVPAWENLTPAEKAILKRTIAVALKAADPKNVIEALARLRDSGE